MDYKKLSQRVGAIVLALIFWQVAAMLIRQNILLVSPLQVARRLTTIWREPDFFPSLWFSFYHIVGGFLLGLCSGIVLAVLAARFRFMEQILWPWMATIKSVPVASFVVICLIWLSARNLSIFISFLIVLPVIYQNVLTGLRSGDGKMEEMARVFHLPWYRRLRYVTLPKLRPFLLSACSITCGMAWKAGVAAEIIGTPNDSMGRQLYLSKIYLDTDDLLAWTVVIVAVSVLFEKVFLFALRRILHEHPTE